MTCVVQAGRAVAAGQRNGDELRWGSMSGEDGDRWGGHKLERANSSTGIRFIPRPGNLPAYRLTREPSITDGSCVKR